jgi:hypothetical protein
MFSFLPSITSALSAIPVFVVGAVAGILIYRFVLVKNPSLLNTLVTKAKTDISSVEALIVRKKAILPVAVVPVVVAVKVAPVAVEPVAVAQPVAAPVAVAPVVVAPVAPVVAPVAVAPAVVAPVATQPVAAPAA